MSKKEEFKNFVRKHPELVNYVKNKEMNWQDFYGIYDIYGENNEMWEKYFKLPDEENNIDNTAKASGIGELTNLVKNINMDNIQKHIKTAQKAISVIQELTSKTPPSAASNIISKAPRPLTKFFDD